MSETDTRVRAMRLLVARCEVRYTGRLTAVLPEAVRLLILKADGSVLVHDDAGGFKPLNWMSGPTLIEELGDVLLVRKPKTEDVLEIRLADVLSDVEHDMGESAALQKDGVERDLQLELAAAPAALGEELRLVKREWPTEVGPVDLMCRDAHDGWVAVEIKRIGTIDAVEQLTRYLELHPRGPGDGRVPRRPRGAEGEAAGDRARGVARNPLRRSRPRLAARRAGARPHALSVAAAVAEPLPDSRAGAGGARVVDGAGSPGASLVVVNTGHEALIRSSPLPDSTQRRRAGRGCARRRRS